MLMSQNSQTPVPIVSQQQPIYEDEINLVDIINILLRRKKLILGAMLATVCVGLIYAFTAKGVYQVETILLPPPYEQIQSLNVLDSSAVNSEIVFTAFIDAANSRKLRHEFFNKFNLLGALSNNTSEPLSDKSKNDIFEDFLKVLIVKKSKKSSSAVITLEGHNEEEIGYWLDDFVVMVNQATINQFVKNLQSTINARIENLNVNISSKRSIYKQRREDELGRLQESLQTAKNLGIHDYNNVNSTRSKNNNLSIYMQKKKRYMQGTKVLQAEITALKNRKSDDIHISGLRDLQEKLTRLKSIKIKKDKLQSIIVDKKANISVEQIHPKRKLIVIISIVLGGMLGIFAIFIMEFISNFRKQAGKEINTA